MQREGYDPAVSPEAAENQRVAHSSLPSPALVMHTEETASRLGLAPNGIRLSSRSAHCNQEGADRYLRTGRPTAGYSRRLVTLPVFSR